MLLTSASSSPPRRDDGSSASAVAKHIDALQRELIKRTGEVQTLGPVPIPKDLPEIAKEFANDRKWLGETVNAKIRGQDRHHLLGMLHAQWAVAFRHDVKRLSDMTTESLQLLLREVMALELEHNK